MDNYLGEIRLVAFNYAPAGWAFCNGALLAIASNTALFSLLGNYYGGDGKSTFALPNLQGRVAVSIGQGTGLSPYTIGQQGGLENTTLLGNNMPAHFHTLAQQAFNGPADQPSPSGSILAQPVDNNSGDTITGYTQQAGNTTLAAQNTSTTGSSVPFSNLQPYLALNYIIALQGIYPSRQ